MTTDTILSEQQMSDLEALIDSRSIEQVLIAISEICGAKAEHVAHAWQDAALAKRWATIEGAIGVIVPKTTGL